MNRIFYLSSVKVNPRVNLQLLMNRVNDGVHILITDSINAWGWSNHEKTAIDGNNGWYGNKSDHLPVNKVGGAVHRVDDPRRFVGKNTRLAFSDRLFADETVEKRKGGNNFLKKKWQDADFSGQRSDQCVPSPNSCFSEPMMIFSTRSSVLVTRSTVQLLVMTLISLSPAFLISYTGERVSLMESNNSVSFFSSARRTPCSPRVLGFLQSPVNQPYKPLQPFWPLFQRNRTPSATDRPFLVIFLTSVRRAAERKRNGFWVVFFFLVKILQWINRKSKEQWHVIYQRLEEDHEHQERMWTHVLRHSAAAAETQPQLHSLWLQLLRNSGCYLRWTWRVCI